jgi:hypothetical protein
MFMLYHEPFHLANVVPRFKMLNVDATYVLKPGRGDSMLGGARDAAQAHADVEESAGAIEHAIELRRLEGIAFH